MLDKNSEDKNECKCSMCGHEATTKEEKLAFLTRKEEWLKMKLEKIQKAKAEVK